jgi:hypothetical protein
MTAHVLHDFIKTTKHTKAMTSSLYWA